MAPPSDGPPVGSSLGVGLVGRWKLDENLGTTTADATGRGNNGTLNGANWAIPGFPAAEIP